MSKPERTRHERARTFDTNNEWISPRTMQFLWRKKYIYLTFPCLGMEQHLHCYPLHQQCQNGPSVSRPQIPTKRKRSITNTNVYIPCEQRLRCRGMNGRAKRSLYRPQSKLSIPIQKCSVVWLFPVLYLLSCINQCTRFGKLVKVHIFQ